VSWLLIQVELGRLDPGPVEAALLAIGAETIELSDAGDRPILEPGPGETPLWPDVRLRALMSPEVPELQVQLAIAAATTPGPLPRISFSRLGDRDWIKAWREDLQPMRFGKRLWICGHGEPGPGPAARVVRLEPGLAFGTGSHPTTALCLEYLDRHCRASDEILDFGCGSGILAIAAAALDAASATAVDNDPQALIAARQNAVRNRVADRIRVMAPHEMAAGARYDGVVANILSGTLIALAPDLADRCRPGAWLALSGILDSQAQAVRAAFAPWAALDDTHERDGWVLLAGRRRPQG
jgi:ribosomal protein L11 methyltransferase